MSIACSTNGEKRNTYGLWVEKPKEKKLLGIPRRRWVDIINMDFKIDWYGLD
jgi:hypothetical protein